MKKIIEFLKNALLAIVYPSLILNLFKVKNLDQKSHKILGNDLIVKLLAFVIAILFVVNSRYTPIASDGHQRTIPNVPVTILIDEENYTYFGNIQSHIDVVVHGDNTQVDMFMLSGASNVRAYVDLNNRNVGVHSNVFIRVEGIPENIEGAAIPNVVPEIEIVRIEEMEWPVTVTVEHLDLGIRYTAEYTHDPKTVRIRGPQVALDQIESVRAFYNASNITSESGTITEQLIVVAHDHASHQVTGVEIIPHFLDFELEILEVTREIQIHFDEEDIEDVPRLHRIISVIQNLRSIQVYGAFTEMDSIIDLSPIDFSDLDEEGEITISLLPYLPDGVYSDTTEIVITVIYEELPPPRRETDLIDDT